MTVVDKRADDGSVLLVRLWRAQPCSRDAAGAVDAGAVHLALLLLHRARGAETAGGKLRDTPRPRAF